MILRQRGNVKRVSNWQSEIWFLSLLFLANWISLHQSFAVLKLFLYVHVWMSYMHVCTCMSMCEKLHSTLTMSGKKARQNNKKIMNTCIAKNVFIMEGTCSIWRTRSQKFVNVEVNRYLRQRLLEALGVGIQDEWKVVSLFPIHRLSTK